MIEEQDRYDKTPAETFLNAKTKILEEGNPCKSCGTPVIRKDRSRIPKTKPGGYYFRWWFFCPNKACKALWMVEESKVTVPFSTPKTGKKKKHRKIRITDQQIKSEVKIFRSLSFSERYQFHLNSQRWKLFRDKVLKSRGRRCEQCRATQGTMHVHHLTYVRLGHEKMKDVKILCVPCHEAVHGRTIGRG